jgi:hypothetical protein
MADSTRAVKSLVSSVEETPLSLPFLWDTHNLGGFFAASKYL